MSRAAVGPDDLRARYLTWGDPARSYYLPAYVTDLEELVAQLGLAGPG